ncbi:hypothetical protein MANES_08G021701v8 [Manihot esculenta]|uniref:Uncharacterized protein n=1 Tax=Manihot esculenta TaxID=3983 RepID=A0A2C9VCR3_MANES|nr:hypothetical protein MANES_08G021701v8 [Manihot esculenta]
MSTGLGCSFSLCEPKTQTQIHFSRQDSIIIHNYNVGFPYYMPEDFFLVTPPMAIEVKEEELVEEESATVQLVARLRKLLKNKNRATTKGKSLNISCNIRQRVHRPLEELTHKLQRFKIKTIKVKKDSKEI